MACPHGLAAGQMSTGRDASGAVLTLRYSFQEMIAPGERPRWWRLHRSPAGRGAAPARRWACPKYQQVIRAPNFVTGFGKEKGGFQRGKPPFAHFQGNVALLRCLQQSKRTGMIRLPVEVVEDLGRDAHRDGCSRRHCARTHDTASFRTSLAPPQASASTIRGELGRGKDGNALQPRRSSPDLSAGAAQP